MVKKKNVLGRNIIYAVIALFVLFALFTILRPPSDREEINLSELSAQINDENVEEIVVKGDKLEIVLQDGTEEESRKEAEASLTETLKNYDVDTDKLRAVNIVIEDISGTTLFLTTILPYIIIFALIAGAIWFMMRQAQKGNNQAISFGRSTARLFAKEDKKRKNVRFKDVAGNKEAKEELREVVDFLRHPQKYLKLGARIPRGVLLIGPPGTGKTLLARSVAGEADAPFFHISGSEFVEMFVGVGASRVRDLFKQAKKNSPSIIFIDEIDAVGRQRGAGLGGGHDEREQTLNQILVEMDGFDTDDKVIVLAATNRPDVLDPALLRPGRFDRRVALDLPDINDREAILKIHAKNKPLASDVKIRTIAERTPGFSGADLANIINEGAILAGRQNKNVVEMDHLLDSIEKVMLGPERKSHILSDEEKKITAYHESGHALVSSFLKHADPVQKVSIVSRGRAAGYTLNLPENDRKLQTRSHFLDTLAVLLGGYTAEKLVFDELTTGAANDLQRASELARKLVKEYGMSEEFGPVVYHDEDDAVFLGRDIKDMRNYSEDVAERIDKAVKELIEEAFDRAKTLLTEKRELHDRLAGMLMEKETLERDEYDVIVGLSSEKKESSTTEQKPLSRSSDDTHDEIHNAADDDTDDVDEDTNDIDDTDEKTESDQLKPSS